MGGVNSELAKCYREHERYKTEEKVHNYPLSTNYYTIYDNVHTYTVSSAKNAIER